MNLESQGRALAQLELGMRMSYCPHLQGRPEKCAAKSRLKSCEVKVMKAVTAVTIPAQEE